MIIAQQKRKENIAEYLLYMYQVEDIIRANELDPIKLESTVISKFEASYEIKREMLEWYKTLISSLIEEKKQQSGHLEQLLALAGKMNELNTQMLEDPLENDVKTGYHKAKTLIEALRMRSGHQNENDVQIAMNGLYGYLILKLQKKEISEETKQAFTAISEWIAALSAAYMRKEEA
jgi:hypothetical protein